VRAQAVPQVTVEGRAAELRESDDRTHGWAVNVTEVNVVGEGFRVDHGDAQTGFR
jgi:hypothetical protein